MQKIFHLSRPVDRGSKGSQIDGAPKLWGPPGGPKSPGRGPGGAPMRPQWGS